jgi:hypothetical protein
MYGLGRMKIRLGGGHGNVAKERALVTLKAEEDACTASIAAFPRLVRGRNTAISEMATL